MRLKLSFRNCHLSYTDDFLARDRLSWLCWAGGLVKKMLLYPFRPYCTRFLLLLSPPLQMNNRGKYTLQQVIHCISRCPVLNSVFENFHNFIDTALRNKMSWTFIVLWEVTAHQQLWYYIWTFASSWELFSLEAKLIPIFHFADSSVPA